MIQDEPAGPEYKQLVKDQKELYTKKDKTDEEIEHLNTLTVRLRSYKSKLIHGNGRSDLHG